MSLFDFPRIHFSGNIDINVPTLNNEYYFPLSLYDQTKSVSFLPPRLYFSEESIIQNVQPSIPNLQIYNDPGNGFSYIEIAPINTIPLLRTWCHQPLGTDTSSPDAAYFPYYSASDTADKNMSSVGPIMGNCPGYWNMYGDMSITMSDVNVTGVQTFDGTAVTTWTSESANIPPSVNPFLQAGVDLNLKTATGPPRTSACMVETISSQSVYASVFCNTVNLFDQSTQAPYFSGGPFRFGALIYSAFRVLNWAPPMSGSARFCSAIPLTELDSSQQSALIQFFNSNKSYDSRPLKGVFVTFTILEVFENRFDQNYYLTNNTTPNPATATTVGSLTPWYEGDMQTGLIGRNLTSFQSNANDQLLCSPIFSNTTTVLNPPTSIPVYMTPAIASLKELANGTAIFSVDMGNSWPETVSIEVTPPAHRGDASFESSDLGLLQFCYNTDPTTVFASIPINPTDNSRASVFTKGCVFDFVITDSSVIDALKNNFISVYLQKQDPNALLLVLQESDYMISSDQKGLYAEQGDLPPGGYRVNTYTREPCTIRIFQKGVPVTTPIPLIVGEFTVPEAGNDPRENARIQTLQLADNDVVDLSVFQSPLSYNAVYYFTYPNQYTPATTLSFGSNAYLVMDTGSFICLRVQPTNDYSQYLDPSHPNYTPPDFNVVYNEIFQLYDVVYPIMAEVHAFTAKVWDNATMARMVSTYTDPSFWNTIQYMPRSRELSDCQYNLLQAWVKTLV